MTDFDRSGALSTLLFWPREFPVPGSSAYA
jgi:hypothetical protein